MNHTINLKMVILGAGEVGKSSIINFFMGKKFPEQYLPTIGSETTKKEYIIKENGNTVKILLSIWDTGGQRAFNPFNPVLYKNIDIALLVFDLTKPKETLELLKEEYIQHVNYHSEDVLKLFIGNKLDAITNNQQIKTTLKKDLTKNENLVFTSAKTGENIKKCFKLLIYTYLRKAEIMYPDIVQNDTSIGFLNLINKDEKQLKTVLTNLNNLDSALKEQKLKPKLKEESIEEKEIKDIKYYDFLKQELEKNATQKSDVLEHFLINLSELDKTIKNLRKSHSRSVKDLIDNLKELLIATKKDFEKSSELISKLNREEFELVQIISKTKEYQLGQKME